MQKFYIGQTVYTTSFEHKDMCIKFWKVIEVQAIINEKIKILSEINIKEIIYKLIRIHINDKGELFLGENENYFHGNEIFLTESDAKSRLISLAMDAKLNIKQIKIW